MVGVFNVGVGGQQTQHGFFAKHGGQNRHTHVHVRPGLQPGAEMSVLGHAVLGNVQVGHDLDTGNQGLVQSTLQRYIIDDNAVNAHAHLRFALERLDVNIGGAGGGGATANSSLRAAAMSLLLALLAALRARTSA